MNELHFRKELLRIVFINIFFGHDHNQMKCPLPELYTFWDRHYKEIRNAVLELLDFMGRINLAGDLMTYVNQQLDTSLKKTVGHLVVSEKDIDLGDHFIKQISTRYHGEYNPSGLAARLTTKIRLFGILDNADPDDLISKDSVIYMQWFMHHSLKVIYKENSKIVVLRRNWRDGQPLKTFLQQESAGYLYSVDQTGGLFFDDPNSQMKYFQLSCAIITQIWDFAQRRKKIFILKNLAGNEK
ncbi:hypothetical protein [Mucilaginibacter sp.]|uniref:hypothetical protein n=1 Tax=Mucilaginibacter sp. TaxID=1882438 RepID=UPI0025DFD6EF|nr:hypothetical protein [Mucilaginibacter sp.]